MTKEEIQAESEQYAVKWKQFASNHFQWVSKGYADGVLSDTARKHWEPKWIPVTPETMPKTDGEYLTYDMYNNNQTVTFFDGENWGYLTSERICPTHWMPLPTFND